MGPCKLEPLVLETLYPFLYESASLCQKAKGDLLPECGLVSMMVCLSFLLISVVSVLIDTESES